jgi:hypothetical protein
VEHLGQGSAGVAVVEADVEHGPRLGGDDVGGRVADVEAGDLQRGGLEAFAAGVERRGGEAVQHAQQGGGTGLSARCG